MGDVTDKEIEVARQREQEATRRRRERNAKLREDAREAFAMLLSKRSAELAADASASVVVIDGVLRAADLLQRLEDSDTVGGFYL